MSDARRPAPDGVAGTLACPMCGAAAAPEATQCDFCRARLATVRCPSCLGLLFAGSRHCSHCGARAVAPAPRAGAALPCPRGCGPMRAILVGELPLDECPACRGTWLAVVEFERLCAEGERQAAVQGALPAAPAAAATLEPVRYRPCPECAKIMNRVNFAKSSGIVLDVCKAHGAWLDAHELRRLVEFLRAGGLATARRREAQAAGEELRLLRLKQELARQDAQRHGGLRASHDRDDLSADSMLVSIFSLFS